MRAVLEPITNVYRDVFTAPPWNESDELVDAFVQRLQHECLRPGFTAWTEHDKDEMVGFATGWPTQPPFPDGRSYTAVANQLGRPWVNRWLVGAMEIDELAVLPRHQGEDLVAVVFGGLSPLVIEKVEDAVDRIVVRARTPLVAVARPRGGRRCR